MAPGLGFLQPLRGWSRPRLSLATLALNSIRFAACSGIEDLFMKFWPAKSSVKKSNAVLWMKSTYVLEICSKAERSSAGSVGPV